MTRNIVKVVIQDFCVANHNYRICIDDNNEFWGFDKNNPREEYNGINGHHGKSLNETLAMCYCTARSDNELDKDLIQKNNINELKKLMAIVETSNTIYPY